mmetsp:Transcript_47191/g.147641  ORF Transcript_47191/g.147641 Transcript_47191/m.147641 type:complete len:586 (-) Transcript_47191:27-1784(-)
MYWRIFLFLCAYLQACHASPSYFLTLVATTSDNAAIQPNSAAYTSDGKTLLYAEAGIGFGRIMGLDVATSRVQVVAGSSSGGESDGIGTQAQFNQPRTVRVNGTVAYITDSISCSIRQLDLLTLQVTTLYRYPYPLVSQQIQGKCYWGLAVDSANNRLYVSCAYNSTIMQLDLTTRTMSVLAGDGNVGSKNGRGTAATFYTPQGIAYSSKQSAIYVSDYQNSLIRKIEVNTREVTTAAGSLSVGCADGPATSAQFLYPKGLVMDLQESKIYVAQEGSNGTVRQLDLLTNQVSTIAGSCVGGVSYTSSNSSLFLNAILSAKVKILTAVDVAVDPAGNAVVVVDHNYRALYATTLCNFVACDLGYWRTKCDLKAGGGCKACTKAEYSSITRQAEPFDTDTCLWACNVGYWQSGPLTCSKCNNSIPQFSSYSGTSSSNICPYACDTGYELYDSCAGTSVCIEPRMRCRVIPDRFCFLSSQVASPKCAQTPFQIRGCAKDVKTLDAAAGALSKVFDEFMSSSSDLNDFFTRGASTLKSRLVQAASTVSGYVYQTGLSNPFDNTGPCGLIDAKSAASSGVSRRGAGEGLR